MKRISSRIGVVVATVGLALSVGPSAYAGPHPLTVRTPPLVPDPGGYLYCRVVATSTTPIGIVAAIMSSNGTNVTEFGTGFRASPAVTGDGLYHAEETAGSLNDSARFCKASVTGARRGDVHVSLTAFDANGNPTSTVEAR